MVVALFSVIDKVSWVKFFEETFLVVNISLKVVFEILFFILSDANIDFLDRELRSRTYIIEEALLTIKHIKLVGKKEFAAAMLDSEHKTFVVHIISFSSVTSHNSSLHDIHPPGRS